MNDSNGTTPALRSASPHHEGVEPGRSAEDRQPHRLATHDHHGRYDPLLHLSGFVGVFMRWGDLPVGRFGQTRWSSQTGLATITLSRGLDAAELRSTLAHEIAHVERGPVGDPELAAHEEALVDLIAASRLIAMQDLSTLAAQVEARGVGDVADGLEVDEHLLAVALELQACLSRIAGERAASGALSPGARVRS